MTTVRTDHQIVPFGDDLMKLFDKEGNTLAIAERPNADAPWNIHTDDDGVPDDSATTREAAIYKMTEFVVAAKSIEGTGFSTLVPHGLTEQP